MIEFDSHRAPNDDESAQRPSAYDAGVELLD
jgi:hypothetical protein